jgi:alginate O-acetyltransferase complex protein AlgI
MLFNSYNFLLCFLPIVWLGFAALLKQNSKYIATYLLIASLVFYGFWDLKNFYVLLPSVIFNYFIGCQIAEKQNKLLFAFAICLNILALIYYKYFYFLLSIFGVTTATSLKINLPLGISFFTFTQITYLADIYKKRTTSANFTSYSLFVNYFPHLIAGPLIHHKDMISQFRWNKESTKNNQFYVIGLGFLVFGLFKKVVIADRLAMIADPTFLSVSNLSLVDAWKGILAYTFQLYFDFSGYSDMAIGISKLFHINMPINFNSPYKSSSIIDFWRKWHMTLSSFLKDYIYIPLGGSKHGNFKKLRNILIVMLVCGIWHGSGYTFLVWGLWHGFFLILNHAWRIWTPINFKNNNFWWNSTGWASTFLIVVLGWVFFKSPSLSIALQLLSKMFFGNLNSFAFDKNWVTITAAFAFSVLGPNTQEIFEQENKKNSSRWFLWRPNFFWIIILACMLSFAIERIQPMSPFLYWQF